MFDLMSEHTDFYNNIIKISTRYSDLRPYIVPPFHSITLINPPLNYKNNSAKRDEKIKEGEKIMAQITSNTIGNDPDKSEPNQEHVDFSGNKCLAGGIRDCGMCETSSCPRDAIDCYRLPQYTKKRLQELVLEVKSKKRIYSDGSVYYSATADKLSKTTIFKTQEAAIADIIEYYIFNCFFEFPVAVIKKDLVCKILPVELWTVNELPPLVYLYDAPKGDETIFCDHFCARYTVCSRANRTHDGCYADDMRG